MDLPASALYLPVIIVLGAIAIVMVVSAILERRYARWVARSPHVERLVDAVLAETAPARPLVASAAASVVPERPAAPPTSAPAVESSTDTVSVDVVRHIVDPALSRPVESYPWRSAGHVVLPFDEIGYDNSMIWARSESDGLVALFHLGSDLAGLAGEMGLDERVLTEELARRVYGAIDPVVDPTRPRTGTVWSAADREAIVPIVESGACLSDTARRLHRDQLDVVARLIHDGLRPAHAATAR